MSGCDNERTFRLMPRDGVIVRERLSERLFNLLKHLRFGFEQFVVVSLRQDQC